MAFDRKISLVVGTDGTGTEIANLDVAFDIERSITVSENQAKFTIYNASPQTRNDILQEGNNVVFKAGYADEEVGTLFIGNIVQAHSVYNEVNWVTEILAFSSRAAKSPMKKVPLNLAYAPGVQLSTIIKEVGKLLDLVVTGAENAEFELINGFAFAGLSGTFFNKMDRLLVLQGAGIFIDNAEIVVYNLEGDSAFTTVFLDETSGLLEARDITEGQALQTIKKTKKKKKKKPATPEDIVKKKVAVKSLINPDLRPNGLMDVKGETVTGVFLVELTRFFGDNFGGDFACESIGTA